MAYVVTQNCCNDATCVAVCPVDCIHPTPAEREYMRTEMLYIDPAACIDCGACSDVCPVDAIVPGDEIAPDIDRYRDINAEYFRHNPRTAAPGAHVQPLPLALATAAVDDPPALRVAIVGSGPSAFYAAEELLARRDIAAEVTMFERLPVAGGLVRFGVAPDHWHTKTVDRVFDRTARRDGFTFHLGVEVGRDVTLDEVLAHHHAVIHASGASGDRRLGIPGEDLPGSHAAREFVAWYNGHPEHADRSFDLTAPRAVVVGNGNVALDVARILVSDVETLRRTDIADHALVALAGSRVEEVVVLGRRGPEHAACTTPELLALGSLPGIDVLVEGPVAAGPDAPAKLKILAEYSRREPTPGNKRIVFRFGCSPKEVVGGDHVSALAVSNDGAVDRIACGMVLRAVGYRGLPIAGLPFDETAGTVANVAGRVVEAATGQTVAGHYVAGWIKRGATGVIGTNRYCAAETVEALLDDHRAGLLTAPTGAATDLTALVRERRPDALGGADWRAIDRFEREQGREAGRPRIKIVDAGEAAVVAGAATR
ncbi:MULTISPECIES: FAD-dependent oxidoreductase [unclassified Rhodococcus (in: high G+C Gram-positive bacteria)]|uniref:FAD-dependent oxidoreductase n=1 Tax=unclassified Rhodococcus (in: high G+C Gram-positive bacteria) TaxID=192944 RepID=UPI001639F221|nr:MULTISPECIES: FAD-dependent oxidoreductase [unclassified Rhodococcus (in: high G+C Gram-positive bacteria)]MBC2639476.1 FAD-dependent oxidoreductase [Rhodococcus sp. 3A]MBC2895779.1 FAD-dependent oxidoreductase [Rhodococcus sp. 4CII]